MQFACPSVRLSASRFAISLKLAKLAGLSCAFSIFLFSCQQLRLDTVADYSSLLPQYQLLYLSLSVQPTARAAGFPYRKLSDHLLGNPQLQKFVAKRLLRSQLALGRAGEFYVINQLLLGKKLLGAQLAAQPDWRSMMLEGPAASGQMVYLRCDTALALQMPEDNLLYVSRNPSRNLAGDQFQEREQQAFAMAWKSTQLRARLPRKFRQLQNEEPLVIYSPRLIDLIVSPLLQRAFPQALSSFARVSKQFPLSEALLWIEARQLAEATADPAAYVLHLELATGSLLLSKGLEAGFRLFLPSLILRSRQEFIRRQLPNVQLESDEQLLHLAIPLNQASLESIVTQLAFGPL